MGAAVPVPVRVWVVVAGEALLEKVRVALAAPVAEGVKVIVYETLFPAAIVTGKDNPVTVNAELLVLAPLTTTLAPLAVSVPEPVPLEPTTTLPMANVPGAALSDPVAATPVPEMGTLIVGFEPFEVKVTFPETVPVVVGSKFTLNDALSPAARVNGVEMPLTLNPAPVTATCETVTEVPPVLVIFSETDGSPPMVTLPKPMLVGLGVSAPSAVPVPETPIVREGFVLLEEMVTVPLCAPVVVGVKLIWKVVLCPADSVMGVVNWLTEKPAPVTVIPEIVTVEPPLLVICSEVEGSPPMVTLPKL